MKIVDKKRFRDANIKALKGIWDITPILIGVLLLISIVSVLIPQKSFSFLFTGNVITDSFIGSILGSMLTGNPVTAYILGKGFLMNGIGFVAVTGFIAAWTTVGIVQLPAESMILGKRFAIFRNVTAFFMSIIVAIVTAAIIGVL